MSKFGYLPQLDGLRAVSILAVLGVHAGIKWMHGGTFGVDIFFVLSGFLITSLIVQEWRATDGLSFRLFYCRRVLRLFPALFTLLAVWTVYCALAAHYTFNQVFQSVIIPLSYSTNWIRAIYDFDMVAMNHTWSLSAEEQFYLIWPLVLILLLRRNASPKKLLAFLVIAVLLINIDRSWLQWHGAGARRLYLGPDTHSDPIMIGCMAGIAYSYGLLPASRGGLRILGGLSILSGAALGVFLIKDLPFRFLCYGGYTLLSGVIAIALLGLVLWPASLASRALSHPCAVWIGRISYGLYLWHMPVFQEVGLPFARFQIDPKLMTCFKLSATFLAATLCYYVVEKPCLRLKHHFDARVGGSINRP